MSMEKKKIICYFNAENEAFDSVVNHAKNFETRGADELYLYNYSKLENESDYFLHACREVTRNVDIPVTVGVHVRKLEEIKKAFYTGAKHVIISLDHLLDGTPYDGDDELSKEKREKALDLIKQGVERFGKDAILVEYNAVNEEKNDRVLKIDTLSEELKNIGVYRLMLKHVYISGGVKEKIAASKLPVIIRDSLMRNDMETLISMDNVEGVATNFYEGKDIMAVKRNLKENGINVDLFAFDSNISFKDLKTDDKGLVPVVVQDYKNKEVLMVAYMNEEAFNKTLECGMMTYYSRSRQELWLKGDTSGHFQYVKELRIDCDNDTILAKVEQIGAACHTGNRSCFYRTFLKKEYSETDASTVLKTEYDTIADRKVNPKEGSYTNYLFDKGIDKILKKVGEEATEIIIASKNPDKEEIKYEIADFMYHLMVLMVQRGITWDDVMEELYNREKKQ
ncbi:MAG TPA: bifunctional phosphoribosyl-AMP cyclohydrolase/phosphoribosyl-ATP pyrophosphatase [Lachnospiraceae bacterium]|nr:bifunctional phosphoribosyl-AMP cyclohydrolase/phosphoribosyl-ATP pyrophosphatase [Lachnospiraceae bacterium]HBR05350.1 bifunctional phosphoribosyl-AMP cyclohydrolase/phosphoribosyl-ATP pyrophosphatase [Lachnospiraceae bacterium]HBZ90240.1 bifunctional phosphoribosyl-AMP cyclohydrolase/phosphoribosyl-ATP pyrophosphatase [Lachnospiraceae bacterium]